MPNLTTIGGHDHLRGAEAAPLLGCPTSVEVGHSRSCYPFGSKTSRWCAGLLPIIAGGDMSCKRGQQRIGCRVRGVCAGCMQEADEMEDTVKGMAKYETMDLELRNSPLAQVDPTSAVGCCRL